jgi:hypothetical protein
MFWTNKEWLEKANIHSPELVIELENATEVEFDWESFSLIIDGVYHPLSIIDDNGTEAKISYKK